MITGLQVILDGSWGLKSDGGDGQGSTELAAVFSHRTAEPLVGPLHAESCSTSWASKRCLAAPRTLGPWGLALQHPSRLPGAQCGH